jgi:hypothetical protein
LEENTFFCFVKFEYNIFSIEKEKKEAKK